MRVDASIESLASSAYDAEVQIWGVDIAGSPAFWRQVVRIQCGRTMMKLVASAAE